MFWGAWSAVLPAIQDHAHADDGQLGVALLFIGVGGLTSMRLAGELVDRCGSRGLPLTLLAYTLGVALPALSTSPLGLGASLLVLGITTGALDVAINAEAVGSETHGRPILNLAHAMFSLGVVGASVATGVLRTLGAGPVAILSGVALAMALVTLASTRLTPAPAPEAPRERRGLRHVPRALLVLGVLAAAAYVVESGCENWSAVYLENTHGTSAGVAALGPALFAAAAVTGRLAGQGIAQRVTDAATVAVGGAVAAGGAVVAALAPWPAVALVGIAVVGLGTSVCAPTLLSRVGRSVSPAERGSALSIVITIAYMGFVVGPAAMGLVAQASSLRVALAALALAALAVALAASRLPAAPVRIEPAGG